MNTYFRVYLDGQLLAEVPGATKRNAQAWVRSHILSTHMGEWRRLRHVDAWHYHTTIGRTYQFIRCRAGATLGE